MPEAPTPPMADAPNITCTDCAERVSNGELETLFQLSVEMLCIAVRRRLLQAGESGL